MEVVNSEKFAEINLKPTVIAIGSFDGIHLGHQAIIRETVVKAKRSGLLSGVLSFEPHPLKVINPKIAPGALLSDRQKLNILNEMGLDFYFKQKFTLDFSRMKFAKFVTDILVDKLKAGHIVVGRDFRFGHHGQGNIKALARLGQKYMFKLMAMEPVKINNRKISSTDIRVIIEEGKIEEIHKLLGRNYQLEGKVIHGRGRGRKLGIPTANLALTTDYVLPPRGVYAVYVYHRGKKYKGIANFGIKPTFPGEEYTLEIHILDFKQNLYDEDLMIELIAYIRDEITFESSQKLVKQINEDILYTESLLC